LAGLEHGLANLNDGVPIGCRGRREVEFRCSQNWIGGTRAGNAHFVQPPPGHPADCMTQLERFIHGGRLGRRLIVLMLIEAGVRQQPLLYMSLFFMQHRSRYYELLDHVSPQEDWEAWLAWGLAQAAAHQHQAAHGVERPQLPHRQQGDRNPGGARHRTGDHRRRRNRLFAYDAYLAILSEGTEPL
jgi:Fic family protein